MISIEHLRQAKQPQALLFGLLENYGFTGNIIGEIWEALDSEPGKLFYSETHELLKDRKHLILRKRKKKSKESYLISENVQFLEKPFPLKIEILDKSGSFEFSKNRNVACLDYERLEFPLKLRKWQEGDYLFPLGMNGKKKLSDYFVDEKFSRFEKEETWILCSGKKIVWIIGHRLDDRFKITPESNKIMKITLVSENG